MKIVKWASALLLAACAAFAIVFGGEEASEAQVRDLQTVQCLSIGQGQLECSYASPWQPLQPSDASVIAVPSFVQAPPGAHYVWQVDVSLVNPAGTATGFIRRIMAGTYNEAGAFVSDLGGSTDFGLASMPGAGVDGSTAVASWYQAPNLLLSDGGDAGTGPNGPAATVTCAGGCSVGAVFKIEYRRPLITDGGN